MQEGVKIYLVNNPTPIEAMAVRGHDSLCHDWRQALASQNPTFRVNVDLELNAHHVAAIHRCAQVNTVRRSR